MRLNDNGKNKRYQYTIVRTNSGAPFMQGRVLLLRLRQTYIEATREGEMKGKRRGAKRIQWHKMVAEQNANVFQGTRTLRKELGLQCVRMLQMFDQLH